MWNRWVATTGCFPVTLAIARMSRNEAQARSLIANRARACPVVVGTDWSLTLEPASLACPPPALIGAWQIHADWSGARFVVELSDQACIEWLNQKTPELEVARLPDIMVAAVLEAGISDAIAGLRSINRLGKVRITRLARESKEIQLPYVFHLSLAGRDGQVGVRGLLHTDSLGLMVIAGLVGNFEPSRNGLLDAEIRVLLRAQIGTTTLPLQLFESLRARDVILFDQCWLATSEQQGYTLALITPEHGRLPVRIQDTSVTVLNSWEPIVSESSDDEDFEQDVNDGPVDLQAVPVRLVFDIGERMITLGELKELQPGQSFDLGRPLSGPVRIRVNGALVGSGELIEIDGHIGVSVLSIGSAEP